MKKPPPDTVTKAAPEPPAERSQGQEPDEPPGTKSGRLIQGNGLPDVEEASFD